MPYLRDLVHDEDVYVRNSMWVDFEGETTGGRTVRFKGVTDLWSHVPLGRTLDRPEHRK